MSELKATTVYDAYWKANSTGEGTGILVYLKSEADKVIAEKDKVIDYARRLVREDLKTICHQKYKRCLAMAKWCHDKWTMSLGWDPADGHTADFFLHHKKWEKRWLELAEKFKDKEVTNAVDKSNA